MKSLAWIVSPIISDWQREESGVLLFDLAALAQALTAAIKNNKQFFMCN